jgi:hypothetical protein
MNRITRVAEKMRANTARLSPDYERLAVLARTAGVIVGVAAAVAYPAVLDQVRERHGPAIAERLALKIDAMEEEAQRSAAQDRLDRLARLHADLTRTMADAGQAMDPEIARQLATLQQQVDHLFMSQEVLIGGPISPVADAVIERDVRLGSRAQR